MSGGHNLENELENNKPPKHLYKKERIQQIAENQQLSKDERRQ